MGSGAIAAFVAEIVFWAVLGLGVVFGEISRRAAVIFVLLWAAGFFGLPRVSQMGAAFVTSYVALLDIVLVFLLFKGDVPLT
ncbi:MAG TPA: hypothetical protein VF159_00420 [Gemmatimonadaceae bacterium]|nr:hypothetical protein [Vicinamibacterales bacterium]